MGVKYFCDRCGKEFKSNGLAIPVYARDGMGIVLQSMGAKILCDECAKRFKLIEKNLKHKEDFFNMTDEDISLTEYDFKIGDLIITDTGVVGFIDAICKCENCKKRGFYEPRVKTIKGNDDIYITDCDKRNNFSNFYQIGKYKFGNIDKKYVEERIESETKVIEDSTKKLEEYKKQLMRLSLLKDNDSVDETLKKILCEAEQRKIYENISIT